MTQKCNKKVENRIGKIPNDWLMIEYYLGSLIRAL